MGELILKYRSHSYFLPDSFTSAAWSQPILALLIESWIQYGTEGNAANYVKLCVAHQQF